MICQTQREKMAPIALTLLRITVGVIMMVHGWDKLIDIPTYRGFFENMGIPLPGLSVYLAVGGEFFGGLGLIVGLLTPIAAFGVFCTMAVAVFHVHFANGLLAKDNGFEYPLTLMMAALYFIFNGGGCISLDSLLSKKMGCCDKEHT